MKKLLISLLAAPAFLSLPAFADEPPPFDRFIVRLGGDYIFNVKTKLSADRGDGVLGTTINTEEDLGVDTAKWTGFGQVDWRFAANHTLEFSYYVFSLKGSRAITRDITFRDTTFTTGAQLDSELKLGVSRLEYLHSFYRSDVVDLGVGIGLYGVRTEATLSAPNLGEQESVNVTAPLPVIGFRMDYRTTPKLDVIVANDFFFLNQGDYSGSMNDFRLLLEHRTFKHLGFGVGFDHFALDADASGDKWDGSVSTDWNGALIYLTLKY